MRTIIGGLLATSLGRQASFPALRPKKKKKKVIIGGRSGPSGSTWWDNERISLEMAVYWLMVEGQRSQPLHLPPIPCYDHRLLGKPTRLVHEVMWIIVFCWNPHEAQDITRSELSWLG